MSTPAPALRSTPAARPARGTGDEPPAAPGATPGPAVPAAPAEPAGSSGHQDGARAVRPLWRMLLARPQFVVCAGILLVLGLLVALAPLIAPYDPLTQDLRNTLSGPTGSHLLGTDDLGRDVLSRLLVGGRQTLLGVVQALITFLLVGTSLGLVAGMSRGAADVVITRLAELLLSVPAFIILLVTLSIVPGNMTMAMVLLGILTSPLLIRVVRATTRSVRGELFVRGARTMGLTESQITVRHVLPRLAGPIIVQATIFSGTVIIAETGLGYLGFGVPLPSPSWGNMVETASQNITRAPWLLVPTGGTIILTIMSFMLMGDAIRDAVAERWSGRSLAGSSPHRRRRPASRATASGGAGSASDGGAGAAGDSGAAGAAGAGQEEDGARPGAEPVLDVQGLTVAVDTDRGERTLVEDISFEVRPGETVCLVGQSGSGKSVTSLAVLGLDRGTRVVSGRVRVGGTDMLAGSPEERRRLRMRAFGYITQDPQPSLDPSMRVGDLLNRLVRLHQGLSRSQARPVVRDLLEKVRIPDPDAVARRYPHQLSGGMAQRIVIAAALSARPRVLVADEPTTALDVTVQAEILSLLHQLCDEDDSMALLLVTHDWGVVADIADRVIVMKDGRIVERSSAERVFEHPEHAHTREMLASDPARLPVHEERPTARDLVTIEDLVITYPSRDARGRATTVTAVDGVDLRVQAGRTLGLIGESGSGKSSIGNTIVGLARASSGTMTLHGAEGAPDVDLLAAGASQRRALARRVQIIFQDPYGSLNPVRTIGSTLVEPLVLAHGMGRRDADARVREALDRVGMPAATMDRFPAQFSGGQRQRIAIARAIVLRPELIVCDEPVSALDLTIQDQVLRLLAELQDELGMAYLFISHDLAVVRSFCDSIAVMHRGRIVEQGAAGDVILRPEHPYTRSLLDAAPIPDPSVQRRRSMQAVRYTQSRAA